ncbi:hypothetical protein DBR11_28930 [Pedobacter sp. HMWF019]|uniref:hypothetical protein n=1 Tax=Pedobacter sp. HMWF019 TaxID=2056856 RepID=UPI000D3CC098|nr:hypothetical protein [Pedobacter sp. HMWF019]PTS91489.1 hypothetical protein DBR11_28930 [Pedobacter sp. HMWF019]
MKLKPSHYKIIVKLCISFAAAHIVSSLGQHRSIFELLTLRAYYIALFFSAFIAFLLLEMVALVNDLLDGWYPWRYLWGLRLVMQVGMGICVPLIVAFSFAGYYYHLHGYDILQTGYFPFVFKLIVPYVLVVNLYCNKDYIKLPWESIPESLALDKPLTADAENPVSTKESKTEIGLVYLESRACLAKDVFNRDMQWPCNTITASLRALPNDEYFLAARDLIIRGDLIESVKQDKKRNLLVMLKPPFSKEYEVSRHRNRYLKAFGDKNNMDWWDKERKNFRQ